MRASKNSRAFTMMEVLVTVAIVGATMVPIISMMIFSQRGTMKISDFVIAQNLAIETMEMYKNKDFETVVQLTEENDIKVGEKIEIMGRSGQIYDTSGKGAKGPIITYPSDYARFNRKVVVENLQGQGTQATELKIIRVIVTWTDKRGREVPSRIELKALVVNEDAI